MIVFYAIFSTAKCVYPSLEDESGQFRVSGYESPMLEGFNIILHCNLGYVLIGSITSTCMENGKWEPDPWHTNSTIDPSSVLLYGKM